MIFEPGRNLIFFGHQDTAALPTRDKIEEKYKWDLTHIYSSDTGWEDDFRSVEARIPEYKKFENTFSENADQLLQCLKFDDEIGIKLEKLYLYSMLAKDSDMRIGKYQAMQDRIKNLYSKVSAASSFIKPGLLKMQSDLLMEIIDSHPDLKVYKHAVEDLLRTKKHTLSREQEEIMAHAAEVTQVPYNTYSMFTNADLKFPVVEDPRGKKTEITHARFYSAMYSKERNFRERVYKSYYSVYMNYANTFASLFNGNLKTNIFNATVRAYGSAREASLDKNNIPISVYDNLIESTNKNLEPLHRWAHLRRELLSLDELHPYDAYVSLFSNNPEKKYDYEEAKEIVHTSLSLLGEDYLISLRKAFNNRWIDVFETQSKRSGAYSSGTTFGTHPYILLNWTDLLNDVFTLTHEVGHNMHSYYTGLSQPYPYANYSIFLAEVASTFNESLLLDYLIEKADSKEEKLYLLEKYLNNITTTFYRQIMFAEFEMICYDRTEKGEALTPDLLCGLFRDIYKKYWGPAMVVDSEEEYTWSRIPHFYYNFYVFQYATGFAASEVLARKVKTKGKPAVDKYLNFLKAGSSDYPLNILKAAGVDMNSPEPVESTTIKMSKLIDEIEALI